MVAVIAPAKSAGRELDVALDILEKLGGRLPEEQAKIVQALHKDLTAIHTTLSETQSAEAEPQPTEGERWTKAITGARDIFRPVVDELNKAALQARATLSNPWYHCRHNACARGCRT